MKKPTIETSNPLIKRFKPEYLGKYCALNRFENADVVAFGDNYNNVLREAERKGFPNPIMEYMSKRIC